MANQLDELNPEIREEGLDTNVIAKKLPAEVGVGSTIFEIMLWVLGIIPGLVFLFMKISAEKHFDQLQQKIQRNASQIDNYLEQRVVVLQNCARLLDRAIDLDKSTFENIAKYRSGNTADSESARNALSGQVDTLSRNINVAVEN
ncbi:MAG: LemA family protein, partial [Clostridia bacterium]|nr:LemA family protein [Clostridia bacterium]